MGYDFFENRECEFYPCHKGIGEINCLFCFCPLYLTDCGGNFTILKNGIKDCSNCTLPHKRKNYKLIMERLKKFQE